MATDAESRRLTSTFLRHDVLFYVYFHGDDGADIGASHQTGWTGLVAFMLHDLGTVADSALLAAANPIAALHA